MNLPLRMFLVVLVALELAACAPSSDPTPQTRRESRAGWSIDAGGDLNAFFECLEQEGAALVDAHRGGPRDGFPENALATFETTMAAAPAILEIDVQTSADGVLYLMHDDTLERTTTGAGAANALSWADISKLRLKDAAGRATDFAPTRFDEALRWAERRTILAIDLKPSTKYEAAIAEIRRQKAEHRILLIAYTLGQAKKLSRLIPEAMISLNVGSQSEMNAAVAAGIPADHIVGFTGTKAPDLRLFELLDDRDVEVMFGTLGWPESIDREIAASGADGRYAEIAAMGADLIATDRPAEAHAALAQAGRAAEDGKCGIRHQ